MCARAARVSVCFCVRVNYTREYIERNLYTLIVAILSAHSHQRAMWEVARVSLYSNSSIFYNVNRQHYTLQHTHTTYDIRHTYTPEPLCRKWASLLPYQLHSGDFMTLFFFFFLRIDSIFCQFYVPQTQSAALIHERFDFMLNLCSKYSTQKSCDKIEFSQWNHILRRRRRQRRTKMVWVKQYRRLRRTLMQIVSCQLTNSSLFFMFAHFSLLATAQCSVVHIKNWPTQIYA